LATAKNDGWIAAAMQASSATDPEVLAVLLRDKRTHVREALIDNPNLPDNVLCELWDIHKDDLRTGSALARHIDLDYAMEPRNLPGGPYEAINILAQRIITENRHDLEPRALEAFGTALFREAQKNSPGDVARLMGLCDEDAAKGHLATLAASLNSADEDFIDLLIQNNTCVTPRAGVLSDAAFLKIMDLNPGSTWAIHFYKSMTATNLTKTQDELFVARLSGPEVTDANRQAVYAEAIYRAGTRRPHLVLTALDWYRENHLEFPAETLLYYCTKAHAPSWWTPPSADEIVELISKAPPNHLRDWLYGMYLTPVRPGDLTRVLSSTTYSINSELHYILQRTYEPTNIVVWAREFLENCPIALRDLVEYGNTGLLAAAVEIITERLGDDPRAWSVLFQCLGDYLGDYQVTLSGALDATETALKEHNQ
jgi:hypothetical protein